MQGTFQAHILKKNHDLNIAFFAYYKNYKTEEPLILKVNFWKKNTKKWHFGPRFELHLKSLGQVILLLFSVLLADGKLILVEMC